MKKKMMAMLLAAGAMLGAWADTHNKVQLWEGGPYWAETNIGAENPEDYGYYFWWGDTVGYKWENGQWIASDGSSSGFSFDKDNVQIQTFGKNVATLQSEGWITADGVLAPEHDAAQVHWGGNWWMPTRQELDDLEGKCDWTWTTTNGVNGWIVRGRGDFSAASIFLPAAGNGYETLLYDDGSVGNFWSSEPNSVGRSDYSWYLYFLFGLYESASDNRDLGYPVRPVYEESVVPVSVTFDENFDGGSTTNLSILSTDKVLANAPAVSPRAGWTFVGWHTVDGKRVTEADLPADGATYYAHWFEGEFTTFGAIGGSPWFVGDDGNWRSGNMSATDSGWSYLRTTVTGPGKLSFEWRTSSGSEYNKLWLEVLYDGEVDAQRPVGDINGETEWAKVELAFGAGEHEVDLAFVKSDDSVVGDVYGTMRDWTWTPFVPVALAEVVLAADSVVYSGAACEPGVASVMSGGAVLTEGVDYLVSYADNVNAGTATITLTGTNLYSGTFTTNFTIRPRPLTQGMVGAIGNHPYTGKAQTPKPPVTDVELGVTLREDVEYTLSYANNTVIGEGIVTVTGKGNYTGSIARTFVIEPSPGSELEDVFGGAGKAESDGAGGWIVTLTNDVDIADLPIDIPDDIGRVTIDLNGHDLIGGDGQPAIVIVSGSGDGEPTVLTVITTGGDAAAQGGEGAPAIEVSDDAQDGVLINIGAGVTVQGGGDDVPAIIGEVGTNEGTIIEPGAIHIPGEGTVTVPKTWKTNQKVTWKAVAAKGSVLAHWEGAFVDSRLLSKNELRNPSLAFAVPADFDTNGIRAVFLAVDDDRLGKLALSQPGPLAPNEEVAGFELLDDSESYVTASVSGLPTGLKFDAKTLAITGKPTKPGVYTVKITAKNASGYQWAENVQLRVADIADARIGFGGLPAEGTVGTAYAGQIAAGEFKTLSASGLPTGLKLDAKSGAVGGVPTKGGYYTVTVTADYPDKTKATATCLMTISPVAAVPEPKRSAYHPLTVLSTNTAAGTATGTGVYAEGKKVSISAKPIKGWVFAGWYRDMKLKEPMAFASADGRTASQSVVVPEVRYLFARFATEAEDIESLKVAVADAVTGADGTYSLDLGACVESLSLPKLAVTGLPAGLKYDAKTLKVTGKATKPGVYAVTVKATNTSVKKATDGTTATFTITVPNFESDKLPGLLSATDAYGAVSAGVALDPGLIDCTPADGWTVKVAGLPTGLKYDAKAGKIAGVPTAKPGPYTVTFTASKKGEANQVATITLNVEALPAWAVGTFDGAVFAGDSVEASGIVQAFTVAANGKISGNILEGGRTWTLSAGQFNHVEHVEQVGGSDVFYAAVVGKAGKEIVTNEVTVSVENGVGVATSQPFNLSTFQPFNFSWTAWQNLWKRADTKADMPVIKKDTKVDHWLDEQDDANNRVTLTFKKDGVVSFAGMVDGVKVSGSSQLVDDGKGWKVTLYAPPKPPFEGWCETLVVTLTVDEQNSVTDVAVK